VPAWVVLLTFNLATAARGGEAPAWMRGQVNAALPVHDEKTEAVILYKESILTVESAGKIRRLDRQVLRILRPDGETHGLVVFPVYPGKTVTSVHAWSIPVAGKGYEVGDRDTFESAVAGVDGSELMSDLRMKMLRIPGATVGSVIGFEVEYELKLNFLMGEWDFQEIIPVSEARFTLKLPSGWSYQSTWLNHSDAQPALTSPNQWTWVVKDIEPVHLEKYMPPWEGIAAQMVLALVPAGASTARVASWAEIGNWYLALTAGRRDVSAPIKQKTAELTGSEPSPVAKMRALANFVQRNIRYVAIELGIGGHQPHPAVDVFTHRYGDCKDKATLLSAMLKEIGIESYYVVINTERGSVSKSSPPSMDFNHVILAIALPEGVDTTALPARLAHPKLGNILFFDPTDELTPFGSLRGELQANYGMLVTESGGELIELPQLTADSNGVARTATMTLDEHGTLQGDVQEILVGDEAAGQRYALRAATEDTDRIKAVEAVAGASFSKFEVLKASVKNLNAPERQFEWHYTLEAQNYAKIAGDLLLVRPRVLGTKARGYLETKEPRRHPIEFPGPRKDTDSFAIAVPAGYVVDELPPRVDVDEGFASYHSKTEFTGGRLSYTRSFEIKELSVPANKAQRLKDMYRIIEGDERNAVVLRRASP
jgi:hypothetical protein